MGIYVYRIYRLFYVIRIIKRLVIEGDKNEKRMRPVLGLRTAEDKP